MTFNLGTSQQPSHQIPTFEGVTLNDLHSIGIVDDASGYLQAAKYYSWRSEDREFSFSEELS